MNLVFNTGIILSFFLSFLLFAKQRKSLTDMLLALWLIIIGIQLAGYYLYIKDYWVRYPHLIGITAPIPLLHGPLLYLYVQYSIKKTRSLDRRDYLHFLPAALAYLWMLPFYFTYSAEKKIEVDRGISDDYSIFSFSLLLALIISGLVYSFLSYRKLIHRKKLIYDNFSFNEGITLNWLRIFIAGIAAIFITAAVVIGLRDIFGISFGFNTEYIFYILIVCLVVYIGVSGIRQKDIFSDNPVRDEKQLTNAKHEGEYRKSGLKDHTATIKHMELLALMEEKKPYLNPRLTLKELAEELSLSPNHLSQVINQYEGVNFHDFINRYRVEEFILRAGKQKSFSLLAHALDSGFNSKSSFNSVFRKIKGTTPGKYLSES